MIGEPESLFEQGVRLSYGAQELRAATFEGLVALDASGNIVPAIAERWIVTDDGLSYIFKLRDSSWPDGERIASRDAQRLLQDNLRRVKGTSLGLDLGKVDDVRAMAGRVIEIRLTSPMPDFLRLLAQPEMVFVRQGKGTGPFAMERAEDSDVAALTAMPPETRGLPAREDWEDMTRPLALRALPAREAIDQFSAGDLDIVLNGQLYSLPMVDTGPLTRGTIRLDSSLGLFGLVVITDDGLLGDPARREALSMAIDREALMQSFNIGGWKSSLEIVPRETWKNVVPKRVAWESQAIEQRRAEARRRIAAWASSSGQTPTVSIKLPKGPGSDRVFSGLASDFKTIGVTAQRAAAGERGDLELIDRVARYSSPRWFLNQFNCEIRSGPCSETADRMVEQALAENDLSKKDELFASAQLEMRAAHFYVPIGAPIRWSLVRGNVAGFQENPWALHPLFPLVEPPPKG